MKIIFRAFIIAFSMYSKIPMPHIEWEDKSMRYALCFFPCIGAVSGLILVGAYALLHKMGVGTIFQAAVITLLPIGLTGGIHMDGYMDTKDAMSSYQPKERRLEILKDAHIGAFAAMNVVCYLLLFFAAATELGTLEDIVLYAACLVISRSMSALCFVTCQSAKKDGLQRTFADVLAKRAVIISSAFYLAASFAICIYVDNIRARVLLLATIILYIYYKHFSNKHFGGITGDLEGYYLQLQELVYLLVVVCMGKLL